LDPTPRQALSWRKWSVTKWESAATALRFPLDDGSHCVRVRGLGRTGKAHFHLVWGRGAPLGTAPKAVKKQATPFVYLYVAGDVNRYAPLASLMDLCDPSGGLASVSAKVSLDHDEVVRMLSDQLETNLELRSTAAEVLGLQRGSTAQDVLRALHPQRTAGTKAAVVAPPPPPPLATAPAPPPVVVPSSARVTSRVSPVNQEAPVPVEPPAAVSPAAEDDDEDEDEEDEDEDAAVAVPELQDVPFISVARADPASEAPPSHGFLDPSTVPFGGLTSVQLYVEKGVAFAFLSPSERVSLIVTRAHASGYRITAEQAQAWSRAQWDRLAEAVGLVFLGPAWFAPLRTASTGGLHAGWCPDRRSFTLYIAVPARGGTRFFTLNALRILLQRGDGAIPAGLPSWGELLSALHTEGRSHAGLAACVRADLRAIEQALRRAGQGGDDNANSWLSDAQAPPPQRAGAMDSRAAARPAAAPPRPAPRVAHAPSLAPEPPLVPPPEGTLPGKSPVELYLTLGLGFAFMKLGAADAKRIARAAQQAPGVARAATWVDEQQSTGNNGSDAPPQLQWLPDATHSQVLPALGRGVRASWGAGRVYIYVPSPVDRFLQTTEIRAGFCDDVLRPANLARGAPFSAWSRVVDVLADAAASNPYLHAALAADSVFPSQLLPPPEDGFLADDTQLAPPAALGHAAQVQAAEWSADDASRLLSGDLLLADDDDDALFAHAQQQRPTANFAPGGMSLPRTEMLVQPWREEEYVDTVLERNRATALEMKQLKDGPDGEKHRRPMLPELEAQGVVLNDTDWGVLSLHSFDLFVRLTPEGLIDLREAYGVDKKGVLDGVSDDWVYTDRWWNAAREVPPDTQPADYQPVDWARRPTVDTPRGDRRRGEETFLQTAAEERKRVYLIHAGDDLSVDMDARPLDFRTVFCVDDVTGYVTKMQVVGLLRRKAQAAVKQKALAAAVSEGVTLRAAPSVGAFERPSGAALADWEETWDLPHDAHLCFSWDCVYVATPDQMEDVETLAYEWMKRNRYKLRSDGTMTGTPLRLELHPNEVARLQQEEAAEEARQWMPMDAAAIQAKEEKEAREEALKEMEREALVEEGLDLPEEA